MSQSSSAAAIGFLRTDTLASGFSSSIVLFFYLVLSMYHFVFESLLMVCLGVLSKSKGLLGCLENSEYELGG